MSTIDGSKFSMPIIVLILGGEMFYILNQRLQAQSIVEEKARKVLQDVVKAMFSPPFIQELFKRQDVYSVSSTKQIFEKLAHSSIMRLNQSSMDKLFDLMTMGFKYEILNCNSPQQYLHVLLVHLEAIKTILGVSEVSSLAQTAIDMAIDTYSSFSHSNWLQLKSCVLNFIQGKRIKVSLFLQHKMQNLDGTLVLPTGDKLAKGYENPGVIRLYEGTSKVLEEKFDASISPSILCPTILDPESSLGMNMYIKGFTPEMKTISPPSSSLLAIDKMESGSSSSKLSSVSQEKAPSNPKSSAKYELSVLADILGVSESAGDKTNVPLRINLFPEFNSDKAGESSSYEENAFIVFDIDGAADAKTVDEYFSRLNMDVGSAKPSADSKSAGDDLLDLMDSIK
jgi:hypothetical protein